MTAPLPSPAPSPERHDLPRVRLEVQSGAARTISYEVATHEFLIGGAAGCDLRLPAPNLPPVVCQLTCKVEGVFARRVPSGLSVLLNDSALPPNASTAIASGDRLTLAG